MPNRWQAITWTKANLVHWCIYVTLRKDELTGKHIPVQSMWYPRKARLTHWDWVIHICISKLARRYTPCSNEVGTWYTGFIMSVCLSVRLSVDGICNFDFVLFWLGIQNDSVVWIIMGRLGVSSECRHSNCSCHSCRWPQPWSLILVVIVQWTCATAVAFHMFQKITYLTQNYWLQFISTFEHPSFLACVNVMSCWCQDSGHQQE